MLRLAPVALALLLSLSAVAQEIADPPFSADEIAAATKVGRTYTFRIEARERPPYLNRMEFTSVSGESCVIRSSALDLEEQPMGPVNENATTFAELEKHAHFPKAETEVSEGELETDAGTFACKIYTVRMTFGSETSVSRYWFATELPGAPVKMEMGPEGGDPVMTMQLVEHLAGD